MYPSVFKYRISKHLVNFTKPKVRKVFCYYMIHIGILRKKALNNLLYKIKFKRIIAFLISEKLLKFQKRFENKICLYTSHFKVTINVTFLLMQLQQHLDI